MPPWPSPPPRLGIVGPLHLDDAEAGLRRVEHPRRDVLTCRRLEDGRTLNRRVRQVPLEENFSSGWLPATAETFDLVTAYDGVLTLELLGEPTDVLLRQILGEP